MRRSSVQIRPVALRFATWVACLGVQIAGVAQLVERNLAKVEVASSNLVTRLLCYLSSIRDFGAWLSPVERCVRDAEVPGSNPGAPTTLQTVAWMQHL